MFGIDLGIWIAMAAATATAASLYTVVSQRKTAKESLSAQEKIAGQQLEAQSLYAGQTLELSKQQMELQSKQRQIDTLANLIVSRKESGTQVYQLPTVKSTPLEQINQAIDKLLRR